MTHHTPDTPQTPTTGSIGPSSPRTALLFRALSYSQEGDVLSFVKVAVGDRFDAIIRATPKNGPEGKVRDIILAAGMASQEAANALLREALGWLRGMSEYKPAATHPTATGQEEADRLVLEQFGVPFEQLLDISDALTLQAIATWASHQIAGLKPPQPQEKAAYSFYGRMNGIQQLALDELDARSHALIVHTGPQ